MFFEPCFIFLPNASLSQATLSSRDWCRKIDGMLTIDLVASMPFHSDLWINGDYKSSRDMQIYRENGCKMIS